MSVMDSRLWRIKLWLWLLPKDLANGLRVWLTCRLLGHKWYATIITSRNDDWRYEDREGFICGRCHKFPEELCPYATSSLICSRFTKVVDKTIERDVRA